MSNLRAGDGTEIKKKKVSRNESPTFTKGFSPDFSDASPKNTN